MTRWTISATPVLALLVVLAASDRAEANTGPKWSAAELTEFADVILSGRVAAVTSGWDPVVGAIYSYVTIDVREVFKGKVVTSRVTLKQLGGLTPEIGLFVADQATFDQGEQVLLYLEARPRDGTLYTSALSQGKWSVRTRPGGEPIAARGADQIAIRALRAAADATASRRPPAAVVTSPVEAASSAPFRLMDQAYRYTFFPPVDVQSGGQPGLADGGFAEIRAAGSRWNSAGSSFRYLAGSSNSPPRCSSQFLANYRVTISFMDPCGEMSDSGGTLAIGGSYFSTTAGTTINGQFFHFALEGFVINNDSTAALEFLSAPGCFEAVETHELGHVLGLGHSFEEAAIMFPSIDSACKSGPRDLATDDIEGIQFIYPPSLGGMPGQPSVTRVAANDELLTVEWSSSSGAPPTAHQLNFFSAGVHVAAVNVGPATEVTIPIPEGTRGVFTVRVTAFTNDTPSAPSNLFGFTVGVPCTAPPAAPEVTGGVVSGAATITWQRVPDATHYVGQVGRTAGAFDLVPLTDVGDVTSVAVGGLPVGFTAWVRVIAVNACGSSLPTDFLVQ